MCENCNGKPGEPLNEEERAAMKAEATAAAMQAMHCFRHRWLNACDGLVRDQSETYGFEAVTRMCWVFAQAINCLPLPEGAPSVLKTTDAVVQSAKEQGSLDDGAIASFIRITDQVKAAYAEMISLAATGSQETFDKRLDEVTDQEGVAQPLVMALLAHASMAFTLASEAGDVAGLDQFKGAATDGFTADDTEVGDLQAMFSMPDADRT